MSSELLHRVIAQHQAHFRAHFAAVDDHDFALILQGHGDTLLEILQQRYGYAPAEAKAAWNDFVLRHVDGGQGPVHRFRHTRRVHRNIQRAHRTYNHRPRQVV